MDILVEMLKDLLMGVGVLACTWGVVALIVYVGGRAESRHRIITQRIPKLSDRLYILADKVGEIDQKLEETNNRLAEVMTKVSESSKKGSKK